MNSLLLHQCILLNNIKLLNYLEWTYSRGNGITYVHWGKSNCPFSAKQLSNGTAVGPEGFGGGANYLCFPDSPDLGSALTDQKDASIVQGL